MAASLTSVAHPSVSATKVIRAQSRQQHMQQVHKIYVLHSSHTNSQRYFCQKIAHLHLPAVVHQHNHAIDTVQDRITSDGRLITSPANRSNKDNAQQPFEADVPGRKRPAGVPLTAPATEPLTNAQVAELVDFVTGCKRMLVLTGAGCSTESNIPDYRGPKGAYSTGFQPMTHQQVCLLVDTVNLLSMTHYVHHQHVLAAALMC